MASPFRLTKCQRCRSVRFSDDRTCSFDEMIRATQRGVMVAKQVLPLWNEMIAIPEIVNFIRTRLRCYPAIRFLSRRLGIMLRVAPAVIAIYREANKTGELRRDKQAIKTLELMSNLYIFQQLDTAFRLLFRTNNEQTKELVDQFRKVVEPFSRGAYRKTPWQFKEDAGTRWL